jgi:hypothetical protein
MAAVTIATIAISRTTIRVTLITVAALRWAFLESIVIVPHRGQQTLAQLLRFSHSFRPWTTMNGQNSANSSESALLTQYGETWARRFPVRFEAPRNLNRDL